LIEQRLEEMMVCAIDNCDSGSRMMEMLAKGKAAKAAAQNNHLASAVSHASFSAAIGWESLDA
jgi:hypothetical protein